MQQKTKIIIAVVAALSFALIVIVLALYLQDNSDNPTLQEARRRECEAVMTQMTQTEACAEKMALYSKNLRKCAAIYDSSVKEDYNFRKDDDGTFFDRLFTNAICYARIGDKASAQKILTEAKYDESNMVSLGPISCDPGSFIKAFSSSLEFPKDKCVKGEELKLFFLKALNDSNFQDLIQMTRLGEPISMDTAGEPHGDCPAPLSEVQSLFTDISKDRVWKVSDDQDEEISRKIQFQTADDDRLMLIVRKENDCQYLSAVSALMTSRSQ